MQWNHKPASYLFFPGDSTHCKEEAEDDDDKGRPEEQVILSEDKQRANAGQH